MTKPQNAVIATDLIGKAWESYEKSFCGSETFAYNRIHFNPPPISPRPRTTMVSDHHVVRDSIKLTDGQSGLQGPRLAAFDASAYQGNQSYSNFGERRSFLNGTSIAALNDGGALNLRSIDFSKVPSLTDSSPIKTSLTTGIGDRTPRQAIERGYVDVPPAPYSGAATSDATKTVVNTPASERVAAGETPKVEVRFGDKPADATAADAAAKPFTFRVNTDGKVVDVQGQEVSKDISFAGGVPKNLVIQVDRPANLEQMSQQEQQATLAAQQAKLNDFVTNALNPALKATGDTATTGLTVQDKTQLLQPENITQLTAAAPRTDAAPRPTDQPAPPVDAAAPPAESPERRAARSPEPVVPPQNDYSAPERRSAGRVNGRRGMQNDHHGSMPRRQADSYFPEGTPAQPGEKPDTFARREMLAAAHNPDRSDPYGTIRRQPDGKSYSAGRYGHSYNHFNNMMHRALGQAMAGWPQEILDQLGNPPDWSKLAEILKKHPELMKGVQQNLAEQVKKGEVPKEFGDKLGNEDSLGKFGSFVNKLKGEGEPPTKEDLAQNFGKEQQDAMAKDTVDRGIRAGRTPGEAALAQHLGIEPDQLTDQQKNDPNSQAFTQAANKFYALGMARQQDGPTRSKNPNDRIDWYAGKDGNSQANVSDISPELGKQMADWSKNWARKNPELTDSGGIGNCTRLIRKLYEAMGVMNLPGMSGVEQGNHMLRSGLFRQVDKNEAREGDLAFRGWTTRRSHRSGKNLGDSLVVTGNDGQNVYGVNGASNREFKVTTRGGYYTPEIYLRPTEKFLEEMKRNQGRS